MRSLRRNLEVQLDTPWLLASRRELIAEELFRHLDDHRSCLEEEEGLSKNAAWAEAWASFGDLKAVAGDFLAQHRLEAYAFYAAFVALFAGLLWPLPSLLNWWFTGNSASVLNQFTGPAFGHRLLVTWELFWLFVLVRTAHCAAQGPARRWSVIVLLFPGYLLLGVLTPFLFTYMFQSSLGAPWLSWFNPDWMRGWVALLQTSAPGWILSNEAGRESFIVLNIIGIYLIRAYAIEGCWQGRDWPRLLVMSLLLILGLTLFFDTATVRQLNEVARDVHAWTLAGTQMKSMAMGLHILKHLLLVGYFVGTLHAMDALYGWVVRWRKRRELAREALA